MMYPDRSAAGTAESIVEYKEIGFEWKKSDDLPREDHSMAAILEGNFNLLRVFLKGRVKNF